MQEHAEFWRLHYGRVAHDERWNKCGVHLVQRVVEWAHRKAYPERRATDLGNHSTIQAEARVRTVEFFNCLDCLVNILQRAVELFSAVVEAFADFPHQQVHNLLTHLRHFACERFYRCDPCCHSHGRPRTAAVVPGSDCRIQPGHRRVLVHRRYLADDWPLETSVGPAQADRRTNLSQWTFP